MNFDMMKNPINWEAKESIEKEHEKNAEWFKETRKIYDSLLNGYCKYSTKYNEFDSNYSDDPVVIGETYLENFINITNVETIDDITFKVKGYLIEIEYFTEKDTNIPRIRSLYVEDYSDEIRVSGAEQSYNFAKDLIEIDKSEYDYKLKTVIDETYRRLNVQ
jgi:hypothetical protein